MMFPSHGFHQRRPVVEGGVLDLAPLQPVAGRRAHPVEDLSPPPFHGAQRTASGRNFLSRGAMRPFRQTGRRGANDGERFLHFVDANLHPVPDVSPFIDRNLERDAVVGGVRMIPAHIQIDPRGAAAHAHDSQGPGLVGMQESGSLQAVPRRVRGLDQRDQIPELALDNAERAAQVLRVARGTSSLRTPPTQTIPRSSLFPVSSSFKPTTISRSLPAWALAITNPTSVAMAPMSATWL